MKKEKQQLIIPFIGLKEGMHHFEFEINSSFFEQFDYSIIKKASFKVKIDFEKKKTLFNVFFYFKGIIETICDRCLDSITIKAKGEEKLIIKFGETSFDETDEIKVISPAEHELDLSNEVYEYIHLLLPSKVEHKKIEECNSEMIEKLNKLTTKQESTEVDPRWAALSKFKDKSE